MTRDAAADFEPKILFENEDFWAFDKPPGISCHDEKHDDGTIAPGFFGLLRAYFDTKVFPVHRLDKVTSGILLAAKHAESAAKFGQLFEQRTINKYYLAISDKKPRKKQGAVIGDMVKARRGAWKLTKGNTNPAVSHFFTAALGEGLRVFLVKPYTGKTHQIRVALKSLGSPIYGDGLYAGSEADRTYLHAYAIEFKWKNDDLRLISEPGEGAFYRLEKLKTLLAETLSPWRLRWPTLKK
ncbi:TIGR01621 family pseudouridine synthase [Corallincola platygyrae]